MQEGPISKTNERDEVVLEKSRSASSSFTKPVDDASQQARTEHSLNILFKQYQKQVVSLLLNSPRENNRLTKAQFLMDLHSSEELSDAELKITDIIERQAQQLSSYQLLDQTFSQKQLEVLEYLALIRTALKDNPVTIENVAAILKTWKREIELSLKMDAGQLSERPSMASSSGDAELINLPKTNTLLAFISHCLTSSAILEKITHEVRYTKPSEQLTKEDTEVAENIWNEILTERYARLAKFDKEVIPKVEDWNELMPHALTYEQMVERRKIDPTPYHEKESKEDRDLRRERVSGYKPRMKQLQKASVVQNLAERSRKEKHPIIKQHCELTDPQRLEMQFKLGIRPISKSRGGYSNLMFSTLTGHEIWQTKFVGARFDSDQPITFPERKALAQKQLLPLFERKLSIHKKISNPSLHEEAASSLDSATLSTDKQVNSSESDLDVIASRLHKMTL